MTEANAAQNLVPKRNSTWEIILAIKNDNAAQHQVLYRLLCCYLTVYTTNLYQHLKNITPPYMRVAWLKCQPPDDPRRENIAADLERGFPAGIYRKKNLVCITTSH